MINYYKYRHISSVSLRYSPVFALIGHFSHSQSLQKVYLCPFWPLLSILSGSLSGEICGTISPITCFFHKNLDTCKHKPHSKSYLAGTNGERLGDCRWNAEKTHTKSKHAETARAVVCILKPQTAKNTPAIDSANYTFLLHCFSESIHTYRL